jgi:hypothetical protein
MSLILYQCESDFPAQIPGILSVVGLTARSTHKRVAPLKPGPKDFAYIISDGVSELGLSGGEEPDGAFGFLVSVPWSWRPKTTRTRRALYDRVSSAFIRAGAKIWVES